MRTIVTSRLVLFPPCCLLYDSLAQIRSWVSGISGIGWEHAASPSGGSRLGEADAWSGQREVEPLTTTSTRWSVSWSSLPKLEHSRGHTGLLCVPSRLLWASSKRHRVSPRQLWASPKLHCVSPRLQWASPKRHCIPPRQLWASPKRHRVSPRLLWASPKRHCVSPHHAGAKRWLWTPSGESEDGIASRGTGHAQSVAAGQGLVAPHLELEWLSWCLWDRSSWWPCNQKTRCVTITKQTKKYSYISL